VTATICVYESEFPKFIRDRIYFGFVDMEPLRPYWPAGPAMPLAMPRRCIDIPRYELDTVGIAMQPIKIGFGVPISDEPIKLGWTLPISDADYKDFGDGLYMYRVAGWPNRCVRLFGDANGGRYLMQRACFIHTRFSEACSLYAAADDARRAKTPEQFAEALLRMVGRR
jgi:hypothetical protein